ncbi:hypothetical protein [Hymenobacter sp.]|jgi:hypothetical protein|uniref:hypothetical protein n=1 Tax=Hymenobacter sp. TaxID=1898978 RepID=UPI002EDA00BD
MKAPIFRAYVRRDTLAYGSPYVWQMRQPFSATTANDLHPTRQQAISAIIRDARHFQTIHENPDPRKG